MIARAAAALAATPRRRAWVLAAGLAAATLLAAAPAGLAPAAARAALVAGAVAAAAVAARRCGRVGAAPPVLAIVARAPLPGGAGLAVVEAGSRRLLVGFGRGGVRLVADLGAGGPGAAP